LSACGNDTEQAKEPTNETEQTDIENKANEKAEPAEQEKKNDPQNNETVETPDKEMSLSYQSNGQTIEEIASLKESDNQDFSIYVLPSFDLRAVEPYNDEVYVKDNDQFFMRINLLPKDGTDRNELIQNTTAELQAVSEKVETLETPNDPFFKNATVMKASNNGEVVTKYIIEMPESIVKLSLFTTEDTDYEDAMLQMAKTLKTGKVME
jgi:hypothetical protein